MSTWNLNIDTYRDKVLGCWAGKNIGGTLGTPVEGQRTMHDVSFYLHDVNGAPLPNDDLDLQLIWLNAVEREGINHITPRLLGEYWVNFIVGPWNEYGVGAANIRNGFYPPLSGQVNNQRWHASNGAWIRSEIWASMFPGSPAKAAHYAWMDACCDHCGDGIYAELFTAALESAAYVENDLRKLINIALAHIPADSRVARSVNLVCDAYDKKIPYREVREMVVQDSADLGWFQAPANVAFGIIGLLYGEGDFEKAICYAVNCGDDTDCTGGLAGAVMGILLGAANIPEKWMKPIGNSICTMAINPMWLVVPETIEELTERVIRTARRNAFDDHTLPRISSDPTSITEADIAALAELPDAVRIDLWERPSNEMTYDLPFAKLTVRYNDGAAVRPGDTFSLTFQLCSRAYTNQLLHGTLQLPEGWSSSSPGFILRQACSATTLTVTAGAFSKNMMYIPLELEQTDRMVPLRVYLPVQFADNTELDTLPNELLHTEINILQAFDWDRQKQKRIKDSLKK
ncbi:MAG: ADP-ribosylglycohydrolase family protein [Lentisphaeria bacterium]|nr:ADP-ribosylglycohydrolase family protein [Lentisphaeria bacterium]